jgi:hypothetical protein
MFVPQVFLSDGSEGQLVALCYKGVLLIVIFEPSVNVDARLMEQLKRLATGIGADALEENLIALQPVIARQFSLVMDNDDEYTSTTPTRRSASPTTSRATPPPTPASSAPAWAPACSAAPARPPGAARSRA